MTHLRDLLSPPATTVQHDDPTSLSPTTSEKRSGDDRNRLPLAAPVLRHSRHSRSQVRRTDGEVPPPHASDVELRSVVDRLVSHANAVGRARVLASTDRGLGGRSAPQLAWAKLRALKHGVDLASRRLWK